MKNGIVISWGKNITRSKSLAKSLDFVDLHIVPKSEYRLINYLSAFFATLRLLIILRPSCLVVVVPPVFPIYAAYIYKYVFFSQMKIFVDMHNGVMRREWANWPLIGFFLKRADAAIAHNDIIADKISNKFNIKTVSLTDPLVNALAINEMAKSGVNASKFLRRGKKNILVPVSYSIDEPIHEILQATSHLSSVNFILTGNYKKMPSISIGQYSNCTFTGFISYDEYFHLLVSCDAVLALTNDDEIQMCALIESISAGKYIIASKNSVNTMAFKDYIDILTCNDHKSICKSVESFLEIKSHGCIVRQESKKYDAEWLRKAKEIFGEL